MINIKQHKQWVLMSGIIILVCLPFILRETYTLLSLQLPDWGIALRTFATRFLGIFIEAVPFLLLGSLVSGIIDAFVTADDIARLIPRHKLGSTLVGALMGFIFPVCECGVVPVVRRLYRKGLPLSVGVAFLLAAPIMNPVVMVSTFVAFGWSSIFIGRFVVSGLVAFIVGLVFAYRSTPLMVLNPHSMEAFAGGSEADHTQHTHTLPTKLMDAFEVAINEFFEMGFYMVIGTLLASLMQTFIAPESLAAIGTDAFGSVLALQLMAFVLSVCSTVDAFLALAFKGTFTTGSIIAFLSFGPMVDIKSTLMFLGVFRGKVVLYLIALPFLLTLWAGLFWNLNLSW